MRTFVGLFLGISLLSAPAFAQEAAETLRTPTATVTLSNAATMERTTATSTKASDESSTTFGFLDQLRVTRAPERPVSAVAPFDTDQLALAWRPGSKWGITLDLTSRSSNDVLPREELSAGAYYQITPRFRFGGALSLNGDSIKSAAEGWREEEGEAGVRIESAFSF